MVTYFTNAFAYIPVINYVFPGSTHDRGADLRFSGLTLATIAACYFLIHRGFSGNLSLPHFSLRRVGLLFGSGRTVLVLVCLIPLFAAILYRKVIPLVFATFAVSVILATLNLEPTLLDHLAPRVQRSLSILFIDKRRQINTGKPVPVTSGTRICARLVTRNGPVHGTLFSSEPAFAPTITRSVETILGETTNEDYQESSAKVGAYESGWWTVIAVTGLVGLLLYLNVLLYFYASYFRFFCAIRSRTMLMLSLSWESSGLSSGLGLGWTNGGFPSTEIMFGFLALLALEDQNKERRPLPEDSPSAPLVRPPRMKVVAPAR